jgi:hypothetical protein
MYKYDKFIDNLFFRDIYFLPPVRVLALDLERERPRDLVLDLERERPLDLERERDLALAVMLGW